ncbi:MAG TPA: hypothetical protein VE010_15885, partial [Thermoanaerobaculia bacterium]|nr:hypothetical protein [Thermoanaerobaculia bacterium]
MSFRMHTVGLIYFAHDRNTRRLLLPDGTVSNGVIPEHYASFFVEEARVDASGWWTPRPTGIEDVKVAEYRIEQRARLSVTGIEDAPRGLDTRAHDRKLPELKKVKPDFRLSDRPDTIAELTIDRGKLEAFLFLQQAVVSTWTVETKESVTITATAEEGEKRLVIQPDTEIVFANTSELLSSPAARLWYEKTKGGRKTTEAYRQRAAFRRERAEEQSHFVLYSKLDANPDPSQMKDPTPPDLVSDHPYIRAIENIG